LLPWIGVICLGYVSGPIGAAAAAFRQKWSAVTGVALLAVFSLLRLHRGDGNSNIAEHLATATLVPQLPMKKSPADKSAGLRMVFTVKVAIFSFSQLRLLRASSRWHRF
jgi:uncharacterized membrane protein